MPTYYKITVAGVPGYDAGEVLAKCEAKNRRQAERILGIDGGNAHLVEAV